MPFLRAVWYAVTLLGATAYYGTRMVSLGFRRVPYVTGGPYDQIPRNYGRTLLSANRLSATAIGLERSAAARPCVFVANHLSWIDVLALAAVVPPPVRFVAKRELGRVPLFGAALRTGRHIVIDRRDRTAALSAYQEAARVIREGMSAMIFAEGTRSRDGRLQEFKKGPFVLAIAAQVPVVPVMIEGTYQVLPRGAWAPRPGPITIRFGDPIATQGLTYDDRDALSARVRAAMLRLGGATA